MLTPEQATFVEYYVKNGKAQEAAMAAGAPLHFADQQATEWLCLPEVINAIQLGISANPFDIHSARKQVLGHAVAMATSDITQAFSIDPNTREIQLRSLNDMPVNLRIAIKKLTITESPVPYDDRPKRRISIELHSKGDAIAQVVKMLGMASPERHIIDINSVDGMSQDELNGLLQSLTKIGTTEDG